MARVSVVVAIVICFLSGFAAAQRQTVATTADDANNPQVIFSDRIMPIFRSPDPSSCIQCHLSSVDLKNYILPSHEKTFVSLRDQGLIDLADPQKSKILQLIEMGEKDDDEGARLIHEGMRKAEYEAFATWIQACCDDEQIRNLPALEAKEIARPEIPDEVIRHARKNRVIDSFVRNVWSQRMRCFPCHTPNEIQPNQEAALTKFNDFESEYGERMRIFKATPAETVQSLIEKSHATPSEELPLINLHDPRKSLLLLKPLAKLPRKVDGAHESPSYQEPVTHMGGLKIHVDDHSYKSFIAWLQDYSNVVEGRYTDVKNLPADNWFATQKALRLKETPEAWPVGTTVQMFVHSRNPDDSGWSSEPVAFTQGTVTPRKAVNGLLFLLAPSDPELRAAWKEQRPYLQEGRYLIKVFVDSQRQLESDPTMMLGDDDYQGQVEIENAKWQIGFPKAETVSANQLSK